jgi:hypothetical protein
MENDIEDNDKTYENNNNYEVTNKPKFLSNKAKNNLINLIAFLLNNKNNFEEKIKPSDLEFKLETDSDNSSIDQMIYKLKIYYNSFNIKRDKVKNISKYKQMPVEIQINDEYYSSKAIYQRVELDFYPMIKKGINLDLSYFPFYTFNKEKKSIEKFKFESKNAINNNNECTLCIYLIQTDDETINKIDKEIEKLNKTSTIWDHFEKIYVIFQVASNEYVNSIIKNKLINKYVFIDNKDKNNKIIYLFNALTSYEVNDTNENLINIFTNRKFISCSKDKDKEKEYFFIIDKNNKIIKLKYLSVLSETISYFLFNLNSNSSISKEKEKNKKIKFKNMKELLYFLTKLKKLDYIFDINFKISLNLTINDELTEVELRKINETVMNSNLYKKEYNYLIKLFNSIRQKNCMFNALEIPTIDIDIDFTKMECYNCYSEIEEDKYFYYCYICKTKYCYECIQKQLENKGKKKYIDKKHNLIFFKTRDKSKFLNIDKSKLGNNKFTQITVDTDFDDKHSASCFGCKSNFFGTQRYICLNCRKGLTGGNTFVDYCGKCIEKMCNNKEEMKKLEKEADGSVYNQNSNNFTKEHKILVRHKHEEHIYLMLPLQFKHSNDEPYFNF